MALRAGYFVRGGIMRRQRLTTFLEMSIEVIAAIILGALTILMFCERNTMDYAEYREVFTPIRRSLPRSLFLSLCFLLLLAMLCYGLGRLVQGRMSWKAVTIGAAILTAVECLAWNAVYPYGPISDQGRTWKVAIQLAEAGGTPVILENPTYFAAYPQQKCMVVVMTPIARVVGGLFGNERGYPYRLVNSAAVAIIVAELCILCHQIYGRGRAVAITAVLSVVFAPNILYSAYVYGTQVALLCSLAGFICCLQYCHTNRLRWLLPAIVVIPIGVLFYISSLIAMIAMVIMVLLHALRQNRGGTAATNRYRCGDRDGGDHYGHAWAGNPSF